MSTKPYDVRYTVTEQRSIIVFAYNAREAVGKAWGLHTEGNDIGLAETVATDTGNWTARCCEVDQ